MENKELSKEIFMRVICKLPHSKSRVPYTYHHDYLRQHSNRHRQMSRAEVASFHTADDIELYSIALTQLICELGACAFNHIDSQDFLVCKKAVEITESALTRYNSIKSDGK